MIDLNIKTDIDTIDNELKQMGYYFPKFIKKALTAIGKEGKKILQRLQSRKVRTGEFKKSLGYKVYGSKLVKISPTGSNPRNYIIAGVAEAGAIIKPNKKKYVVINSNQYFTKTKKEIRVEKQPFFDKAFDSIKGIVTKLIIKEVEKLIKKESK